MPSAEARIERSGETLRFAGALHRAGCAALWRQALPRGLGVKVSSEMLRAGGEPIPVDYLMRKSGDQWKVFDVMVEGVSFVQTFRNQFDTPLKQKSIPQVAADIKAGKLQAQASTN